jgi:hypothetical protein
MEQIFAKQKEVQEELEREVGVPVYNIAPLKAISPLASPSSLECEEGKQFMQDIGVVVRCVEDIKESTRLMLERLQRGIFIKRPRMTMGLGAIT